MWIFFNDIITGKEEISGNQFALFAFCIGNEVHEAKINDWKTNSNLKISIPPPQLQCIHELIDSQKMNQKLK